MRKYSTKYLTVLVGGAALSISANAAFAQVSDSLNPDIAISIEAPAFWAISVADLDRSADWYRMVFGTTLIRDVQSRDGAAKARILRNGPLVVELIERAGSVDAKQLLSEGAHAFDARGLVKVGLYVADARVLHERFAQLGLEVDDQVGVDEYLHVLTFILRDIDGNRIQVFQDVAH